MSTDLIRREWPKVGVRSLMYEQSGVKDTLAEDAERLAKTLGYQRKLADIQEDKKVEVEVMAFVRLLLSLDLGLPLSTKEVEGGTKWEKLLGGLLKCSLPVTLWIGIFSAFYSRSIHNNDFLVSVVGGLTLASIGTFVACKVVFDILSEGCSYDCYTGVKFIDESFVETLPDKFVSTIAKIVEQSPDTKFGVLIRGRGRYSRCQGKIEEETIRIRKMFLFAEVAGQRCYLDHVKF